MQDLQIFENTEFGKLEIILIDSKPYFPATECAEKLGYTNPRKAIIDHCEGVTKRYAPTDGGGMQEKNYIPEGDLYRLIIRSKLPDVKRFEKWVFDEVLPCIRKHGLYAKEALLKDPDLFIEALQSLKAERERNNRLEQQAVINQPKIIFADAVTSSQTSILVAELAKILKQNGVEIGGKRMFQFLRDEGFLIKRQGTEYNMPTQYAMERGLFEIKETAITHSDGHITVSKTPKVTGKGQSYFINMFLERKAA